MKNKKGLKIILIICLLLLCSGLIIWLLKGNTKKNDVQIKESEIAKISILNDSNPAIATELVKQNIVKIKNKVGESEIIGTGFFYEKGYLITNSHVVDIKGDITIEYYDGTVTTAQLISNDILSDIAILYVENPKALAMNFISTLDLKVTDEVFAIGFPYDFEGEASVTKGILSARRSAGGIEFLQTDMSLNSGFSGGPLINGKAQLLGINSYATENSTIGMSISSENLETIIDKLLNNKEVNYVEEERNENVLSVVLKDIGYNIEDIYCEKELINKNNHHSEKDENQLEETSNQENSNNKQDNIVSEKHLSNINTLDSLIIENYEIKFNKDTTKYTINLKNNEESLNIIVTTTDSKATYVISGNKLQKGDNIITITVTAEDGSKKDYQITVINPYTKLEKATKIVSGLNTEYNSTLGVNCFHLFWEYRDTDNVVIYPSASIDIVDKVIVDVYAGWSEDDSTMDSNGKPIKLLKTYEVKPTGFNFQNVYIPISDIRNLLTDEDYEGGVYSGADLTFKLSVITKEQGTFQFRNPWGLEKQS